MAGLTFQPNSIEETHQERVAREVKQLLLDIRRIKPQEEKFCAFGDLFVDEDVQQVSLCYNNFARVWAGWVLLDF